MVFKKLLASMGAGGADIEAVLHQPNVQPGNTVEGEIRLAGGEVEQDIEHIKVELVGKVKVESGDSHYYETMPFHGKQLSGKFEIQPELRTSFPFALEVPWETPINHVQQQPLHGSVIGVRTELSIDDARDDADLDEIAVHPLPAQQAILDAFAKLGFRFMKADLERGKLRGTNQRLPFYQEIEFRAGPPYNQAINEVEVSFVAGPQACEVVLEADKRGGLLHSGGDSFGHFTIDYATGQQADWANELHQWFARFLQQRGYRL